MPQQKQNLVTKLHQYRDTGVLVIRLVFGFRLLYGVLDNILRFGQMLHFRDFLNAHGFPFPLASAFLSVGFQFLAGLSFISGLYIRLFSAIMILNFLVAIFMVHLGGSYLDAAPAIHLLAVSVFLMLNGAGKWAVGSNRATANESF